VHETTGGEKRKPHQSIASDLSRDARALQKVARAPAGSPQGQGLQGEGAALAEAQALKLQAHREDLTVWEMKSHPSYPCPWVRLPVAGGQDQRGAHNPDREETALDLGEKAISH